MLVVFIIATANFALVHLVPGDAADVLAGESGSATPEYMQMLRQRFGLDKSLPEQYAIYIWNTARLDLGYSFRQNAPVLDVILSRLPATLLLMLVSLALALLAGVVLGALAARRPHSLFDTCISTLALLANALRRLRGNGVALLAPPASARWLRLAGGSRPRSASIRSSPCRSPP